MFLKSDVRIAITLLALFGMLGGLTPSALSAPLLRGKPVRILPMGDSITEGKGSTDGGYRKPLLALLTSAGFVVTYVGKEDNGDPANRTGCSNTMSNPNHEGYGSMRIDELMNGGSEEGHTAPAIEVTLDADKPDVILIMLGTNDICQGYQLDTSLGRLDQLVGRIYAHSPKVKIVLAAPTPMSGERGELSAVYGSGVPLIVAKYKALGHDIVAVDMYHALTLDDLNSDYVHPKDIGYAKMANAWFQALTGITPSPVTDSNAPPGDLAFNKPYVCSDPNTYGWTGLTDGVWAQINPGCFATNGADTFPKTVTIDLQQPQTIASVVTATMPSSETKTVDVSVSSKAETGFQTVATHVFIQNQDETYTYRFPSVTARYVRLTFDDHYPNGTFPLFMFLQEVEVEAH